MNTPAAPQIPLPCPFCGEDGEVDANEDASCSNRACALCLFCMPVAEWNHRPQQSAEPVAWYYKDSHEHFTTDKFIGEGWMMRGDAIRLFADQLAAIIKERR